MLILTQQGVSLDRAVADRPRRINQHSLRALAILCNAIESLADGLFLEYHRVPISWRNGRIEAIKLLMEIIRHVYFECPELPTIKERSFAVFHSVRPPV